MSGRSSLSGIGSVEKTGRKGNQAIKGPVRAGRRPRVSPRRHAPETIDAATATGTTKTVISGVRQTFVRPDALGVGRILSSRQFIDRIKGSYRYWMGKSAEEVARWLPSFLRRLQPFQAARKTEGSYEPAGRIRPETSIQNADALRPLRRDGVSLSIVFSRALRAAFSSKQAPVCADARAPVPKRSLRRRCPLESREGEDPHGCRGWPAGLSRDSISLLSSAGNPPSPPKESGSTPARRPSDGEYDLDERLAVLHRNRLCLEGVEKHQIHRMRDPNQWGRAIGAPRTDAPESRLNS